jgi:hypothetical protein
MKKCGKCGVDKELSDFNINPTRKDGYQYLCRVCEHEYKKNHYLHNKESYLIRIRRNRARVKEFFIRYKQRCICSKCGEKRWYVLDFHHPHSKDVDLSRIVHNGCSIDRIKKEIRKCIVLCSNCHRELHYKETTK